MKNKGRISALDETLRKRWLLATVINWVGWPMFICFAVTLYAFFQGISISRLYEEKEIQELLWLVPAGLLQISIIYYFAYKKHGTKLLTLWLILGPFQSLANIIKELNAGSGEDPIWLLSTGLEIAMYIWWYFLSIQLLKLNDKIRAQTSIKINLETN